MAENVFTRESDAPEYQSVDFGSDPTIGGTFDSVVVSQSSDVSEYIASFARALGNNEPGAVLSLLGGAAVVASLCALVVAPRSRRKQ